MWNKGIRFKIQKAVLTFAAFCCLAPAVYLAYGSLRIEDGFSLGQFEHILLLNKQFFVWFWNSTGYTLVILALNLPISILGAYGLSQFSFPGKKGLSFLYMSLMLLPFQATVVSQYLMLNQMELLDTRAAIILPCAYSAFGAFLLTQFMRGIAPEILEAARLDGTGTWKMLWHIVLPLCRPAVVSVFLLQMISLWSMVDQPLLFLRSETLFPLSLKLGSQTFGTDVFAAGLIYSIPPVLMYLYCQDAMEQGISLSSIQ